mgnify:CR=1 FL=1
MKDKSVFEQLDFDPADTEKLRLQSPLATEIERYIKNEKMTQVNATNTHRSIRPPSISASVVTTTERGFHHSLQLFTLSQFGHHA